MCVNFFFEESIGKIRKYARNNQIHDLTEFFKKDFRPIFAQSHLALLNLSRKLLDVHTTLFNNYDTGHTALVLFTPLTRYCIDTENIFFLDWKHVLPPGKENIGAIYSRFHTTNKI